MESDDRGSAELQDDYQLDAQQLQQQSIEEPPDPTSDPIEAGNDDATGDAGAGPSEQTNSNESFLPLDSIANAKESQSAVNAIGQVAMMSTEHTSARSEHKQIGMPPQPDAVTVPSIPQLASSTTSPTVVSANAIANDTGTARSTARIGTGTGGADQLQKLQARISELEHSLAETQEQLVRERATQQVNASPQAAPSGSSPVRH